MSLERANRRAAFISLLDGLTLTESTLVGSPLALTGKVASGPVRNSVPSGETDVRVTILSGNTGAQDLWYQARETVHIRLMLPVTDAADDGAADAIIDQLRQAITGSTFDGYVHLISRVADSHHLSNDGQLGIDLMVTAEFMRPPGG